MSKRTLSILGIALGLCIIIATLLMGFLGFPHFGFGWKKITMGSFGSLVLILGTIFFFTTKKGTKK
jgi:uncharacterized RDD family membrane protein YckC